MTESNSLDEREVRLKNLEKIKEAGINPYPEKFDKKNSLAETKALKEGTKVKVAGRLMTKREMGKIAFCHLQDASGKMQIVFKADEIGKEQFKFLSKLVDLGDFLG